MPQKPYPREQLVGGPTGEYEGGDACDDGGLAQPDAWSQSQPDTAGEFVPGYDSGSGGDSGYGGGYAPGNDSIISDQP